MCVCVQLGSMRYETLVVRSMMSSCACATTPCQQTCTRKRADVDAGLSPLLWILSRVVAVSVISRRMKLSYVRHDISMCFWQSLPQASIMSCFCHGRRLMVGQSGISQMVPNFGNASRVVAARPCPSISASAWVVSFKNIVGGILKFIHQVAETV